MSRVSAARGLFTTLIAAATLAALIAAGACGDSPSPAVTATPTMTAAPSPGADQLDATPEISLDLASDSSLFSVSGIDAEDFMQGVQSLSHGDFNDDGFQDLLVGAPFGDGPDNSREDAGEAYVIFGRADPPTSLSLADSEPDLTIFGAAAGDSLGFSVLGADVNGDGLDDIIVGAPAVTGRKNPRTDQGQVYVFFGSRELGGSLDIAAEPQSLTVTGSEGFSRLGHAIASGDVNGDGRDDLILGAPFAGREPGTPPGGPRTEVGEVYVIFGAPSLAGEVSIVTGQQGFTMAGQQSFGQFGAAVAAGDVNGDGIEDIVVGAPQVDQPDESRRAGGAVYVFSGASDLGGKLSIAEGDENLRIIGAGPGYNLGIPIVTADANGDGVDDVIAGARRAIGPGERSASGAVRIVFGSDGLTGTIDLAEDEGFATVFGAERGRLIPTSLAVSDLNRDGTTDLILGSGQGGAEGRDRSGLVHVLLGRPDLSDIDLAERAADLVIAGANENNFLGSAVDAVLLAGSGPPAVVALAAGSGVVGRVYVVPYPLPE